MLQTYKSYTRRTLAMLLAVLVAVGALFSGSFPVHAADGTISYKAGANIPYGSYFTSRMSFDGSNTAYCVEPLKKTPSSGSYSYDLLSQNSPLRKALYYLNGGYGYDKVVKDKYFSAGGMITAMSSDIWLSLTSMPVIPLTPELSMAPRSPILIKHWK